MKYTTMHSPTAIENFTILAPMGGNVSFNSFTPIKKRLPVPDKRHCSDSYKKMFVLDVVIEFAFAAAHVVDMYNVLKPAAFVDVLQHIPQLLQLFGSKMQSFAVVEDSGVQYLRLDQVLKDMTAVGKLGIVSCTGFLHFA